jgi:hypothetical protein
MPVGGVSVRRLAHVDQTPSTTAPFDVVVTDGAVGVAVDPLLPANASMGLLVLTPL